MRTGLIFWAIVTCAAPAFAADAPPSAEAGAPSGNVDVQTSDGTGVIFVDGKRVGEGAFRGPLLVGEHEVRVTRDGFKPFVRTVVVERGRDVSVAVALIHLAAQAPPPPPPATFEGVYGGLLLGASLEPAGATSTLDEACAAVGAVSCSSSAPVGATLGAYAGYTWDPVGLELFAGGSADYSAPSAKFDGVVQPGSNALLTGAARTEDFRIVRVGLLGAVRARATYHTERFRLSAALGPGVAYRFFEMDRTATLSSNTALIDTYHPTNVTDYWAPALSFDVSGQLRLSEHVAFVVGVDAWIENAGTGAVTAPDGLRFLGPSPLRTPSYRLASGTQFYLWPYLGLQFGP